MSSRQFMKRSSRSSQTSAKSPYHKPLSSSKDSTHSQAMAPGTRSSSSQTIERERTHSRSMDGVDSEHWVDLLLRNHFYRGCTREQVIEFVMTLYDSEEAAEEAHKDAILYARHGQVPTDRPNIVAKPTDDEPIEYFKVSQSVTIRMWPGSLGYMGQYCLDFVNEKHEEISPPAGYKLYTSPFSPMDELLSAEASAIGAGLWRVGPVNPTDTYLPLQNQLLCVQVPGGGRKFFRTPVGPVIYPYTLREAYGQM